MFEIKILMSGNYEFSFIVLPRDKQDICQKILSIRQCDAEKIGVSRSALKYIKDRIRNGTKINLNTKAVRRLVS